MLLSCVGRRVLNYVRITAFLKNQHSNLRPQTAGAQCLRGLATSTSLHSSADGVPLRKQLKDEAKAKKTGGAAAARKKKSQDVDPRLAEWELTVGIEIHAQLNTARKLFSGIDKLRYWIYKC